jgi:hypothetical protein
LGRKPLADKPARMFCLVHNSQMNLEARMAENLWRVAARELEFRNVLTDILIIARYKFRDSDL